MNTEPVRTASSLTAVATALLALLVAFGLPLTELQTGAILGVVAVANSALGEWARSRVTPVAKAERPTA